MTFILSLNVRTRKNFFITSKIFIKILSLLWRKKLTFLDILLKRNNGKIFVLVHRKPTHTGQYLYYRSNHQKSCKKSAYSSFFNRAYSVITNKDDLHEENARIKQVLKENGYQEGIISKIFRRITNNHSMPQSQQLM